LTPQVAAGGSAALGLVCALGMGFVMSRWIRVFSGWSALAQAYPERGEAPRPRTLGSGVFRGWFGYNNSIFYSTDSAGLHMTALPILMSGHEPICIPWSELERVEEKRAWYGSSLRLVTRSAAGVDFAIRGRVASQIKARMETAGVPILLENS